MADAPIVITDAGDDTPAVGKLFKDINFFLSVQLPTRSRFVADVEANGGRVVKAEKHADFVIVDHMRKSTPAGSFSYTLIEQAVRDGAFPNPADHALGPVADSPRAAGSSAPTKRTRTAFTAADDVALWQWVELAKAQGELIKGNDIYKRLEVANPRHTWQAWRDHYVKKLIDRPPRGANIQSDASSGQSSVQDSEEEIPAKATPPQSPSKTRRPRPSIQTHADGHDFDLLLAQAKDIEEMDAAHCEDAWEKWAQLQPKLDAVAWRHFWEADVRPVYREAEAKAKRRRTLTPDGENASPAGAKSRKRGRRRDGTPADGDAMSDLPGQPSPAAEIDGENAGPESPQDDDLEAPDEDLEALEAWRKSAKQESSSSRCLDRSDVPASGVDRAVDQQVRAETNAMALRTASKLSGQIITSDANHAADLQLRNEARGSFLEQHQPFVGHMGQGQVGDDHGLEANGNLIEPANNPGTSHNPSQALTEANLASQQAQHAEPWTRGVDLPKDDQNKDQSDYVRFLQNVTGQPQDGDKDPETTRNERSQIPVSSTQEVENVMQDAFEWPSSPQRKREQPEIQGQKFETQLLQPKFALPKTNVRGIMPDVNCSGQSAVHQMNGDNFPSQGEYAATTGRLLAAHQNSSDTNRALRNKDDNMAQSDIFEGLDDINDGQIDICMPAPDRDFTSTSSPTREGPVTSQRILVNRGLGDAVELKTPNTDAQKTARSNNVVVDISSDAPSSSMSSSNAAEFLPTPANTLQGRRNHVFETQDIINAETQAPDFLVPLPYHEQDNEDELRSKISERNSLRTQESSAAETQASDFSVPLPSDWDAEIETGTRSSGDKNTPQPKRKQKVVESHPMDVEKELESWLDTQHVRGFAEASAIAAMQRSSMRPDLAELVLHAEKGGLGLPDDVPGIWSEREDQILEGGDSGALRRLEAKHGWDECEARMRFLAEWREA